MLVNKENIVSFSRSVETAISLMGDKLFQDIGANLTLIKTITDGHPLYRLYDKGISVKGYICATPVMVSISDSVEAIIGGLIEDDVAKIVSDIVNTGIVDGQYNHGSLKVSRWMNGQHSICTYRIYVNDVLTDNLPQAGYVDERSMVYLTLRKIVHAMVMNGEYEVNVLE